MTTPSTAPPLDYVIAVGDIGHVQHHEDLAFYTSANSARRGRFIGSTYDGRNASGSFAPAANNVFIAKAEVPYASTVTNVEILVSTAGVTGGANGFVGLYDSAGNLLGTSAETKASWTTTGIKVHPLVTPVPLPGGIGAFVYVAFLIGTQFSGTAMQLRQNNGTGDDKATNFDQLKPPWNCAVAATGAAALPSTVNLATATSSSALFLAGLS